MSKKTTEKKVEEAVKAVAEEVKKSKKDCDCGCKSHHHSGGAVYGLGLIGALVYFIQQATSFGDGLYGVLKAIVWPAVLIYKALQLLGF